MTNRTNYDTSIGGIQSYFINGNLQNQTAVSQATWSRRIASDYGRTRAPKVNGNYLRPTNYSLDEFAFVRFNGTYRWFEPNGNTGAFVGCIETMQSPQAALATDLSRLQSSATVDFQSRIANRTLIKLRNKVKDSDVNLAQAFAERRETARTIGDTLTLIAKAAMDCKHGHWKRGLRRLGSAANPKNAPDMVLAFNYGVKPLCTDMYGAVEALDKRDRGDWRVTVKASTQEKWPLSGSWGDSPPNNGPLSWRTLTGHITQGSYARVDLIPDNSSLIKASQLGLTNPMSLAWEIVPFSFVVDWAWPLGDYFSSWDALLGWEVLGFSQSNISRVRADWQGRSGKSNTGVTYENTTSGRYYRTLLTRTASTTVPFPMLPSIKDPFSKLHVLNALALLGTAFKR